MGFPYEVGSWDGVTEVISTGYGSGMQGMFSLIAIIICIVALAAGQIAESKKYTKFK